MPHPGFWYRSAATKVEIPALEVSAGRISPNYIRPRDIYIYVCVYIHHIYVCIYRIALYTHAHPFARNMAARVSALRVLSSCYLTQRRPEPGLAERLLSRKCRLAAASLSAPRADSPPVAEASRTRVLESGALSPRARRIILAGKQMNVVARSVVPSSRRRVALKEKERNAQSEGSGGHEVTNSRSLATGARQFLV